MTSADRAKARDQLRALEAASGDSPLRDDLRALGDAISVGAIADAMGVAIGRNIRQVVNHFDVPPEAAGALLDLRAILGTALLLDTVQYQWGNLVADKTRGFVGRDYVFQEIDRFLTANASGYLTIAGDPGIGKSSILAEYVRRTGCIAHFNVRASGITTASQFLQNVCAQLISDADLPYQSLPDSAARDGAFLLKLLHEAALLAPGERLVIAVDALDEVDTASQPRGSNILFLPTTLPDGVYFLMTQRNANMPFKAPHQVLDLMAHPTENRDDVEAYLRQATTRPAIDTWIADHNLTQEDFVNKLADLSENNFMYLYYVLPEIERGVYQALSIEGLPTGLDGYYMDHWQHMDMTAKPVPRDRIRIVYILCEAQLPVSRRLLSEFATDEIIQVDEVTVQEVLDDWKQFLHKQSSDDGPLYSIYHSSFRNFLHRIEIVRAAGVQIEDINVQISNNLWGSLFGTAELSGPDVLAGHDFQPRLNQLSPEARSYVYAGLCKNLIAARQFDRLDLLLTNLEFLAGRIALSGPDEATRDYRAARAAQVDKWAEDGGPAQFSRFLSRCSQFLRSAPHLVFQEAFNSGEIRVQGSAANLRGTGRFPISPWLRRLTGAAEDQHKGQVISMAFWGDERYLTVSTTEREVWVWDCLTGKVRTRCRPPPSPAKSLAVSPSGDQLAAGYGSTPPTPLNAGVLAWAPDGGVAWARRLGDWVYTVRWRSETEIIAGGGAPSGSDAIGRLWKIDVAAGALWKSDVAAARSTELGGWLADRPLLLTWDPVPGSADEISTLSMDGVVCRLTPEFVPMTAEEVSELVSQVLARNDLDALEIDATIEAGIAARRPATHQLQSPCPGDYGFYQAAQALGPNTICMLGEDPVPVEFRMFHDSVPDALYVYDLDHGTTRGVRFNPDALEAGFRAICLGATMDGSEVAIGTAHGEVLLVSVDENHGSIEPIHEGDFAVTAICFSDSGASVAIGGGGGEIAVYDRTGRGLIFATQHTDRPLVARIADSTVLILHHDRLAFVPLRADAERGAEPRELVLPGGGAAIDFDRHGDTVVVLTSQQTERDAAEAGEEDEGEAAYRHEAVETVTYSVHVVDLATRQIVQTTDVPGHIPPPPGSTADARKPDFLRWIRLRVHKDQVNLLVGSARGLMEYPFLAFDNGRPFLLPYDREAADQRHSITVIRGLDLLDVSVESVSVSPAGAAIYCGYANNEDHPRISGELHVWDTRTATPSEEQRFPGTVQTLAATSDGVVIGTDDNTASFWQHQGDWRPLNEVRHGAEVVAVACSEECGLACSVSRDGALVVWPYRGGPPLVQTFVDVELVSVGFAADGRRVWTVDRNGGVHVWEIEDPGGRSSGRQDR